MGGRGGELQEKNFKRKGGRNGLVGVGDRKVKSKLLQCKF